MATTSIQNSPASIRISDLLRTGAALFSAGNLSAAEAVYRQVLELAPAHPNALQMLGLIAYQSGNVELALRMLDYVIRTAPGHDVYYNRAQILKALDRHEAALESVNHAIQLKPDYPDAVLLQGIVLQEAKKPQAALESYEKAIALQPGLADAWNNRGSALRTLGRYDEAFQSFERAIQLKLDHADAYYNRGNLHLELDQYRAAIESYDQALRHNPRSFSAWNNRGTAFQCMQDPVNSLISFENARRIDPDFKYLLGNCIYMKRHVCDWEKADSHLAEIERKLGKGMRVINPFALLPISDSPALQKRAAELYVAEQCEGIAPRPISAWPRHDRIRIGYFSSDFRNHAVSYHMAGVFERHDRSRFEIYGFSSGPDTGDAMRRRVSSAMDHFFDVRETRESDVVRLSREHEIDIAVNLTGLTNGDRIKIFAERAAPIQVNYLGYPGTMGADFVDYIVADEVLIPEDARQHYSEKIAYLPDCFQANDSTRVVPELTTTRAAEGLPENGFVYCCFNNCGKITPDVFELWMRILNRVPGSVLWMMAGSSDARDRLRTEAARRGVSPERLVFARPLPLDEHLSRQQLADLFLDTLPFNAGATASPALWAGLPILTRIGDSFAGRMGASLLKAVGLAEMIAESEREYESKAVEFGINAKLLQEITGRLKQSLACAPLFDTARFTVNIERAYMAMHARLQAGLPPDHITL